MRRLRSSPILGALVASSMLASSSVAVASQPTPAPQINSWAALTALSGGAPAAALCGAAAVAAAAQPAAGCVLPVADAVPVAGPPAPVPVPPVEPVGAGFGINPLYLALGALAAGALLYFILNKSDDEDGSA